jgi:hypothetical protein
MKQMVIVKSAATFDRAVDVLVEKGWRIIPESLKICSSGIRPSQGRSYPEDIWCAVVLERDGE